VLGFNIEASTIHNRDHGMDQSLALAPRDGKRPPDDGGPARIDRANAP